MPVSLSTVSGKSIMLSVSCVERGVTRGAGTSVFTPDRDVSGERGVATRSSLLRSFIMTQEEPRDQDIDTMAHLVPHLFSLYLN